MQLEIRSLRKSDLKKLVYLCVNWMEENQNVIHFGKGRILKLKG